MKASDVNERILDRMRRLCSMREYCTSDIEGKIIAALKKRPQEDSPEEDIGRIVRDMMEHNTYGLTNELRRNGQLQIFLSLIAESAGTQARPEEDRANQYVKRAVEFIQRNYCNPVKVTDVADYVCINRSYLYTLFENSMGMSPQQFLTAFRLTRAAAAPRVMALSGVKVP